MSRRQVTIVDYGVGNLLSIQRAIDKVGATSLLATRPEEIACADLLLLPGVGAFRHCAENLHLAGFTEPVLDFVRSGRQFLGICVGMQLLFETSKEFGECPGLGLIEGTVEQIPIRDGEGMRKVPHTGWAPLDLPEGRNAWSESPLATLSPGHAWVYFVHSFSGRPKHASDILAHADYLGFPICAAVQRENIAGLQFHPEKSGAVGLAILSQFVV